jgi:hypothetical protein
MSIVVRALMISNAFLFFFGAVQHVGIALGPFHEPRIVPAAIVETICGLFLAWGSIVLFSHSSSRWVTALIANLVAIAGVLLGMAALSAGRGPRTASNDLHHQVMLALAGASLLLLFLGKSALQRS